MVQWLYLRGGGGDWYIPTKINNNNNNKKKTQNKQITNQKETNMFKQKTQTTHSLKAEVREYSL